MAGECASAFSHIPWKAINAREHSHAPHCIHRTPLHFSSHDIPARIERFNAGREPERLALKYLEMCKSPFSFFRGTAHLFWEDLGSRRGALPDSPLVWACGDLHLENFGSFQGNNGLSYFDLNDFDEAALAPAIWEVSRFVASVYVAAPSLNLTRAEANELLKLFLDAYQTALADGKARWIERDTASGMVRTLLERVKRRKRAMLIDSRTNWKKGQRRFRIDGQHTLAVTEAQRREVTLWLGKFAKSQADPKFFKILDVARRVAGVGSLGLDRYVVLVRGDGGRDGNAILDAKQAAPSSLARFDKVRQPVWKSEPDRIVSIQHRMQAIAPALLDAVKIRRGGYVLRELQPSKDRLTLKDARGNPRHLRSVARAMGNVTAWAQLRSSGRQGSATADKLIAFAGAGGWRQRLIDYGQLYGTQVQRDYKQFVDAQKDGASLARASGEADA
jgi:uncharacterized protein (DUF2252 family)